VPKHKTGLQKFFLQVFRLIHQLESKHRGYSKRFIEHQNKKATAQRAAASGFSIEA
jgi:hypothetical protein